ncbi:MAG: hypothetical protein U1F77_02670 [Kiritimatiellia bacterium]
MTQAQPGRDPVATKTENPIVTKMKDIIVDDLSFKEATAEEVINNLVQISREKDVKEGVGINIVLLTKGAGSVDAPAAPAPAAPAAGGDFGFDFGGAPAAGAAAPTGSRKLSFSVKKISVYDALNLICENGSLHYTIENGVVVVRDEASANIVTRFYPVDPSLMSSMLPTLSRARPAGGAFDQPADAGAGGADAGFAPAPAEGGEEQLKDIFKRFGAKFPGTATIAYEPAISQLIVSNTPENLEKIEEILEKLQITPRQIEIEARFVEVLQSDLQEIGVNWILTDPYEFASQQNGAPISARPRLQVDANSNGFTQGNRKFFYSSDNGSTTAETPISAADNARQLGNVLGISGVLTNPELRMVLNLLDQKGNSDLLSAPRVTTLTGVNAVIEVVREIIYPTEFDVSENDVQVNQGFGGANAAAVPFIPPTVIPGGFETRQVGVILNVTPTINPDNYTINLVLLPEIAELVDWLQYGTQIGLENGQTFAVNMPQPVFASRNVTTTMVVWDGHTVVMGGLIREDLTTFEFKIPLLERHPRSSATSSAARARRARSATSSSLSPRGWSIRRASPSTATPRVT